MQSDGVLFTQYCYTVQGGNAVVQIERKTFSMTFLFELHISVLKTIAVKWITVLTLPIQISACDRDSTPWPLVYNLFVLMLLSGFT